MKTKFHGVAVAALVAVFAISPALAADVDDCEDKWDDSKASAYCSDATVSWWAEEELCRAVGSCSITVSVDDVQTTFTPNLNHTKSKERLAELDICFVVSDTVTASVKKGCGTTEVTSDTATSGGLTTTE